MYQFIETIYYYNHQLPLIKWHEQRFARTQLFAWRRLLYPSLEKIVREAAPPLAENTTYKCRVRYDQSGTSTLFTPYLQKNIRRLIIKKADNLDYAYKYENRGCFEQLCLNLQADDEVLIVKNKLLTDTSFTNIALWNGSQWQTPSMPLLQGVQRQELLSKNIIIPQDMPLHTLSQYTKIRLFNAMVNWNTAWELPVDNVIWKR